MSTLPTTYTALPALGASSLAFGAPATNVAELVHRLGDIPLQRIRMQPFPGSATVADVVSCQTPCRCELIEGTLVEKAMGYREGLLELFIAEVLRAYNRERRLGKVTPASSMLQIHPNVVRLPDVAFTFWSRFPQRRVTDEPAPRLVPDLAVEVLSPSNTRGEMQRKRLEYFSAGTQIVWIVDPDERTVAVYSSPEQFFVLHETETLDGGDLLPGFSLSLSALFAELDELPPTAD